MKKNARRTLKEIGASDKRNTAPRSNPRPGTEISKPVFGCELFVAHQKDATDSVGRNRKLFTAIHIGNVIR
jgi:hypothetical protein